MRLNRTPLQSLGPFREVHSDGHEKLGSLALKMGEIGFAVYGYKDKWSDSILYLVLVPDSRSAAAGGHIFLDFVEDSGCKLLAIAHGLLMLINILCSGIPIQLTTDKGPEIGYQHAFMITLRYVC